MATRHNLKTEPGYFASVKTGKKNFECRKDDRNYKVGDELLLQEWKTVANKREICPITEEKEAIPNPASGDYTGNILHRRITYVLRNFEGLQPGFCILGLENL